MSSIDARSMMERRRGRIATADEAVRVVAFFAGPRAAFVSGPVLRVDGGQGWPG